MNYYEFQKQIIAGLKEFYGDSADVDMKEITKNNGVNYQGIWVSRHDGEASVMPLIYAEELYTLHIRKGYSLRECIETVTNMERKRDREKERDLLEKIMDAAYVRENVYPAVCNKRANVSRMKYYIHRDFLDLTIYYQIRVEDGELMYSTTVSNTLLRNYSLTEEELHEYAIKNLNRDGYKIMTMGKCMCELLESGDAEEDDSFAEMVEPEESDVEMLVLTNRSRRYGAAAMLNIELLRKASKGRDLIVIPSSVHELIAIPDVTGEDLEEMDGFVRRVNREMVLREEQLADHCYFFDSNCNELRMRRAAA